MTRDLASLQMQGKQKGQLSTWLASAHCRLMANLYNGNILLYNYNNVPANSPAPPLTMSDH
jgi:hypothetical protein